MSFAKLSEKEQKVIFQCLNAILKGDFLANEFQTRLGIEPEELKIVLAQFPNIDDTEDDSFETLAINNCLNEVCCGISFSNQEWPNWFDFEKVEAEEVYRKWTILRGWKNTGIK